MLLFHTPFYQYRLSPGDVLSIQLWAYPEITPPIQGSSTDIKAFGYPIDSAGNVQLPLVGQVHIAGKTLAETNKYLRNQFAKYLKHLTLSFEFCHMRQNATLLMVRL